MKWKVGFKMVEKKKTIIKLKGIYDKAIAKD